MATPGSDIDVIVLVDSKDALVKPTSGGLANTDRLMSFSNDSDPLRAVEFLTVMNGVMVDVTAVIAPCVKQVYSRLRSRGPELSENEILTLGRLRTGWLLWESEGYLDRNALTLTDPALDIYCSTKHFVAAQAFVRKGTKALGLQDIPLALHLGRSAVEAGYLAYFASQGLSYLGAKWLAQVGCAHGAAERVRRNPLLKQSVHLLFPSLDSTTDQASQYLRAVADCLGSIRSLIEQQTLFRIAFKACPQIN
jgi:hypothetical protein